MSNGLFPIEAVVDPVLLATVRLEVVKVVVGEYGLDPRKEDVLDVMRILTDFVLEG